MKKEILRFLIVGGIAVLIDGLSYFLLVKAGFLTPSWDKRISFLLGSIWAFFMNKYYTFKQKEFRAIEPFSFTLVYLAGWFLNSVCHDVVLRAFANKALAFLAATALSTCTNFAGQKWLVFHRRSSYSCRN